MNKVRSILHSIVCCAALFVLLTSCDNNVVYQDAKILNREGWYKRDLVTFDYQATDTTGTYNVIIDIRNTNEYEYQNLWLFLHSVSPDSIEFSDTLECVLADNYGRWIGKSSGSMYELPVIALSEIRFPKAGNYRFDLAQGMRTDTLQGIHEIGIRIEQVKMEADGKE